MNFSSSMIAVVILAAVFATGEAIKCHQCTSYISAQCGDPFHHEDGTVKTEEFLQECPSDKEYTLCRKIYQNVRGDERIIRGCGHIEYKNPCYTNVQEEYNPYICTCKGDGCNGSTTNG